MEKIKVINEPVDIKKLRFNGKAVNIEDIKSVPDCDHLFKKNKK